jgi:hypothetical protein
MAEDDLTSPPDKGSAGAAERAWDGVKRGLGTDTDSPERKESHGEPPCTGESGPEEVGPRCPRDTRGPELIPRPSLSSRSARLAAVGALLALAAALLLIVIPAVLRSDPAGRSEPAKIEPRPVAPAHDARRAGEKRSVRPGPGRSRRGARDVRGGKGRQRRLGRRATSRPSHSARAQPSPPTEADAEGAPVSPTPPRSGEPVPAPAEQPPRGEGGLVDGSRSSSEFGL